MAHAFPLPTECLYLVIRHLAVADEPDSNTLATLLRVSKYVHSVTLPILYEDPFRFVQDQFGRPSQNLEILPRLLKLIRLLLFSLPEGQVIADILRAAYLQAPTDQDNTFAPEPPFFPYYKLVTNINFRRYLLEEISVNIQDQDLQVVMVKAAARELCSELIWSLCEANAGRIKNLTIPIMDISRYVSMIPRLKVLSKSVPPLIKPTALNDQNWIQFAAKPQETDLSLVKSIGASPFMSSIGKLRPFFQPAFGRQINDVALAFGTTLKDIRASGDRWRELTDVEKQLRFSVGEDEPCWEVPQLSNFVIKMNCILIRIHPDIISGCRRLTRIFIRDPREEYRLDEVARWTPAELPELISLYIEGTPAICFDPDTLKSTLNFETMEMTMNTTRAASP
ncbi:hypothetical protein BGX24_000185 [Mortierella sp. AD032]|nr:hypothetical protein BGX24_000185 [Mortierella sp. AD032]